jgi:hypothetical protein
MGRCPLSYLQASLNSSRADYRELITFSRYSSLRLFCPVFACCSWEPRSSQYSVEDHDATTLLTFFKKAGNVFMKKAAELLVPLLSLPTTDGVTGLLVLAWVQYGQNSESGFWVCPAFDSIKLDK